jgi:hypothetical protein
VSASAKVAMASRVIPRNLHEGSSRFVGSAQVKARFLTGARQDTVIARRGTGHAARARQTSATVILTVILAWSLPSTVVGTSAQSSPQAIPAGECLVAPRTRQEIAALLTDPSTATPAATTAGQTLPAGEQVAAETAAAMDQTVQMWLACQNAGESLRAWSLFSDGYLFRLLSRQGGLSSEAYRELATPAPVAVEAAAVLAIEGERLLPDGRFGATVTVSYPSVPMPKRFFFYFIESGGRLVIDGILGEISFSVP